MSVGISSIFTLVLVACGDGMSAEQRAAAELRTKVRAAYAQAIDSVAPRHVILTWPDRFDRLPADKQVEIEVVHEVLTERALPNTRGCREDYLETIEVGRGRRAKDVPAYLVPIPIAEQCREGTVLFVNFAVDGRFHAAQHPRTRDYGLEVLVWDDPMAVHTRRAVSY